MRTTVEITSEQHRALGAIAHRRGIRGFSSRIQEALDAYLTNLGADEVDLLLGLEGMLTDIVTAFASRISQAGRFGLRPQISGGAT